MSLVVHAGFCLMLTTGAASFVHECRQLLCGQLHQAVFAAVAGGASLWAVSRVLSAKDGAAMIVLFGTLPILLVHVLLVLSDPNESTFFPLSSVPAPAIAALTLGVDAGRRRGPERREGSVAPTCSGRAGAAGGP